jgi:hypothetical protein
MRLVERPTLASGGVNEAVVVFDFCEKWDGYAKTAVFYRDEEQLYPMLLENDSCFIPWEVYSTPGTFYFTVFGVKEEIRKTANTLRYKATKGIPDGEMIPSEPTQEMYEQIIDRLDKLEQNGTGGGVSEEQLTEAVNEALEEAKASGDFKGEPGEPGDPGADYILTPEDKQEIAEQAAELVDVPEAEIPSALPNPNALTFTGAVSATYDGSQAVTVAIPQGGGGEWRLADSYTLEEDVASIEWTGDTEVNEMFVAMNGIVNNEANDLTNTSAAAYVRGIKATGNRTGNIFSGKNMFFVRTGGAFPSYLSFTRRENYIEAKGVQCESQTYGTANAHFGILPTDSFVGFMLSFNKTEHRAKAGMTVEVYVR